MPIRPSERARYPKDWKAISDRIKRRARNRCECRGECGRHAKRCAAKQSAPHPTTGSIVVLTVAHLDHVPEHVDPSNLRAYCQACHNNYDMPMRKSHAKETRRQKKITAGQMVLLDVPVLPGG